MGFLGRFRCLARKGKEPWVGSKCGMPAPLLAKASTDIKQRPSFPFSVPRISLCLTLEQLMWKRSKKWELMCTLSEVTWCLLMLYFFLAWYYVCMWIRAHRVSGRVFRISHPGIMDLSTWIVIEIETVHKTGKDTPKRRSGLEGWGRTKSQKPPESWLLQG